MVCSNAVVVDAGVEVMGCPVGSVVAPSVLAASVGFVVSTLKLRSVEVDSKVVEVGLLCDSEVKDSPVDFTLASSVVASSVVVFSVSRIVFVDDCSSVVDSATTVVLITDSVRCVLLDSVVKGSGVVPGVTVPG